MDEELRKMLEDAKAQGANDADLGRIIDMYESDNSKKKSQSSSQSISQNQKLVSEPLTGSSAGVEQPKMKTFTGLTNEELKTASSSKSPLPKINQELKSYIEKDNTASKRKEQLQKELSNITVTPENQDEVLAKTDELSNIQKVQESNKKASEQRDLEKQNYSKIGSLTNKLATGSSQIGADFAAVPELVYDIFSAPQNAIADVFDIPSLRTDAEKFKKTVGVNNVVKDYYKKEVEGLKQKAQETDLKYSDGIYESFINGDYSGGFDQLTNSFAESLPASASMMVGGAYTKAPQLIAASSMMFGAGKNEQLKDENPDMNANTRVSNALATGLIQGASESLGTGSIGAAAKGLVQREGEKKAVSILKDGLTAYYKNALMKNPLLASMSGEGLEEVFQGVSENAVDVVTGVKPKDYNIYKNMADDFIGGAFGGAVFGGGLKGLQQVTNYQDKAEIKNNTKKVFNLQSELSNPELSQESKAEITKTIDGLVNSTRKLVQKNVNHIESLPEAVKKELLKSIETTESTQEKARQIKLDPNTSNETKQILLDNIQKEYKSANEQKTKILEGSISEIDVLPLKQQDKLKREALKELTEELNPDGKKNITIDNNQISERANKIYEKQKLETKPPVIESVEENIETPELDLKIEKGGVFSGDFLNDFDFLAEGSEHTVYKSKDGKTVVKIGEPHNSSDTFNQRVSDAKEIDNLIGDGSLSVIGTYRSPNGAINPVYQQNFIEGKPANNEQISNFMKDKGFVKVDDNTFVTNDNGVIKEISDVSDNFIIDSEGNITAIDASIRNVPIENISSEIQNKLNETNTETTPAENQSQTEVQEPTNETQAVEEIVLPEKLSENETTPEQNINDDGSVRTGVEPVDEVRTTEQENIIEEPVSTTTEPRTSEEKVEIEETPKETALKNADIAEKRKELGLEERDQVTRKKGDVLLDSAVKKIKEGYDVDSLIEDVLDSNTDRTLTDEEVVILKQHQLAKENRLVELGEEIVSATNEGISSTKMDKLIQERDNLVNDIDKAYRAGEQSGTVTARALQARKLAMLQDYSLANMLIQKRKSVGKGNLTSEEIQETSAEYAKIKKLKEQLESKILNLEKENNDLKAGKNIEGLKREERKGKRKEKIEEIDADISNTVASLRKKLREQAGKLSANAIPIEMIPDIAKLAQLYVKKGVVKLDDIVDGIYTSLKEDIQNLSKDDIKEIIGNYDYELEANNDKRLASFKKRSLAKIQELKDRLGRQDFEKKQNTPVELDEEARKLKDELREAKFEWEKALEKDVLERRTKLEKARDGFAEVLSLPRSIMASIDFSAPLRQGLVLTVNNPVIASKAFVEMFRQAASQNRFDRWLEELKETPQYQVMKDSGLYIADTRTAKLSAKEEQFMSNLADKIPLIGKGFEMKVGSKKVKLGGLDLIGGSERAYVGYLNKLRTDVFAKTADVFEKEGLSLQNSPKLYKALGDYINSATGRGNLGKWEESSAILNSLFFSPRLIASRINLLTNWANPQWYANTPPKVRQMYALDMAKLVGVGVTLLSLASLGGAEVEEDPRSSDFGKIKVGDTRWDIWGGFQQFVRFMAQFSLAQRKNTKTKQIKDLDGTGFNSETRASVFGNMIRSKMAPVPGTLWNLASGKTMVGEEYGLKDVPNSFLPLFASDLYKAMERDGASKGVIETGIPAVFGVGVQTYGEKETKSKYNPEKEESEEKEDSEKSSEK